MLKEHYKNSFIWKTGKYKATIEVYILKKDTPFTHVIEFELNNLDIIAIEKNLEYCNTLIHNEYIADEPTKINWEWIYIETKEKL